jgi:hypothetical protein
MNAAQWRAQGYKTIFRQGCVSLVRPLSGIIIQTEVANGAWMRHDNVNQAPWRVLPSGLQDPTLLPVSTRSDFAATLQAYYCDQAGVSLCDFCAGLRPPSSAENVPAIESAIPWPADTVPARRTCTDDSCDAAHCPVCGGHKAGWYEPGPCQRCIDLATCAN